MNKICVCMIVRDEQEMLGKCLESVKYADEFVICDTGSEDNTIQIVKDFLKGKRGKLVHFKWIDDFAAARNYAQSKVRAKWVLIIDADEELINPKEAMAKIKRAIQKPESAFGITVDTLEEVQRGVPRVMRSNIKWQNAAHNAITYTGKFGELEILIKGLSSPNHERNPDRTLKILEKELTKDPNNLRNIYYYGREFLKRGDLEKVIFWYNHYIDLNRAYTNEAGEVWFLLGHAYRCKNMTIKAIECLYKAIMINPNHKDAWAEIGNCTPQDYRASIQKFMDVANNTFVMFDRQIKIE